MCSFQNGVSRRKRKEKKRNAKYLRTNLKTVVEQTVMTFAVPEFEFTASKWVCTEWLSTYSDYMWTGITTAKTLLLVLNISFKCLSVFIMVKLVTWVHSGEGYFCQAISLYLSLIFSFWKLLTFGSSKSERIQWISFIFRPKVHFNVLYAISWLFSMNSKFFTVTMETGYFKHRALKITPIINFSICCRAYD